MRKKIVFGKRVFHNTNKKKSNMDLNLPAEENVSLCAGDEERVEVEEKMESVEELLGRGVEEEKVWDGVEEGKEEMETDNEEGEGDLGGNGEWKENGASDVEEVEKVTDGAFNRRASRRKSCQLAKEKILRLHEDSDEWEDVERPRRGPKRKRKRVKSEHDGGETAEEEKNGKEESPKRRWRRRRKPLKDGAEEEVEEEKNEGGIGKTRDGRYSLRTNRDKQDHVANSKGRKKLEENVNDWSSCLIIVNILNCLIFPFLKLYG